MICVHVAMAWRSTAPMSGVKTKAIYRHGPSMKAVRDELALSVGAIDDGTVTNQIDEQRSLRLVPACKDLGGSSEEREGTRLSSPVAKLSRRLWLQGSARATRSPLRSGCRWQEPAWALCAQRANGRGRGDETAATHLRRPSKQLQLWDSMFQTRNHAPVCCGQKCSACWR